ncbi:MAG: hypothetical protein L0G99_02985 [Propionibacteriales bacterium]|nr:hypothetical protein [Propionibacteriales bacterium]
MARRWTSRVAALALLGTTLLTAACGSQEAADRRAVTSQLEQEVPILTRDAAWQEVTDLRRLASPSQSIRADLATGDTVYRVITAEPMRAEIVLWRRAAPGAEPFNANRVSVGRTCAEVIRTVGRITSAVIPCPVDPPDGVPDAEAPMWDRNANARARLAGAAEEVGFEVKWMLFRNDDATQPRTQPRTAADIRAAIGRVDAPETKIIIGEATERDDQIRGTFGVTATAGDAVDATRTATLTGCFAVAVDLTWTSYDGHENWNPANPTPC